MDPVGIAFALSIALAGGVIVAVGLAKSHQPALDAEGYIRDLEEDGRPASEFERKLEEPFALRVLHPLAAAMARFTHLTPRSYLEKVHKKLLHAGLTGSIRAEEFVVGHAAVFGLSVLATIAYLVFGHPSRGWGVAVFILAPTVGALAPAAWLAGKVEDRKDSILKDLPDTLDLLAISVEAGMGFEGALDIVCQHFSSPLAEEFKRTLKEMELGLSRRDAFHNLKRRTDVPELSNFILAVMQADALGIPIGRVLKTQSTEMRNKRRQWAREKAAKLPVKMLFPLMLFIFPAIMIVILGPAGSNIVTALK